MTALDKFNLVKQILEANGDTAFNAESPSVVERIAREIVAAIGSEFAVNERVLIAPDFSNDGFVPFEATVTVIDGDHITVKDDGGEETFWMTGNVRKLTVPKTTNPLRYNYKPDDAEVHFRRAVHVLWDSDDEVTTILMNDKEKGVYLEAFIPPELEDEEQPDGTFVERPVGTVEYMVCDGLPGDRSHGNSFYTLKEAIAHFKEVVEHGGWKGWGEWVQRAI